MANFEEVYKNKTSEELKEALTDTREAKKNTVTAAKEMLETIKQCKDQLRDLKGYAKYCMAEVRWLKEKLKEVNVRQ